MTDKKKTPTNVKSKLHARSMHKERYDLALLVEVVPQLAKHVKLNKHNNYSIDFFDPLAVKMLNTALLKHHYGIAYWEIPEGYLCPPIPGRADYLHHCADLLANSNNGNIPIGNTIKCLDIGTGASCIYPLLGNKLYGWSFTATELDPIAFQSAKNITRKNKLEEESIEIRNQEDADQIYIGILQADECYDLSICNPPFHESKAQAQRGTLRKLSNLKKQKVSKAVLNFGGNGSELWYKGGERRFVRKMIEESRLFSKSILWFTTLISKEVNLPYVNKILKISEVFESKTIPMGQGNKISRIVSWTFHNKQEQKNWQLKRWS
jgi:23S rRNA (adenine1618-N6)-methyltransferase